MNLNLVSQTLDSESRKLAALRERADAVHARNDRAEEDSYDKIYGELADVQTAIDEMRDRVEGVV